MKAVFKHELNTYFTSLTSYVFAMFLLIFTGVYSWIYNINYQLADFSYVLSGMSFVFLVIVPIMTMRVIAEERRQKTDQLLYSLPINMTQVVMGKFGALMCVFLAPLALICTYPLLYSAYGTVNFAGAYASVFGLFLLGAALMSIGMYISSVTDNLAVAAGICFVVMLLNYFLSSLASMVATTAFASFSAFTVLILAAALIIWRHTKNGIVGCGVGILAEVAMLICYLVKSSDFEGLFTSVLEKLSLFERFETFTSGIFDITGVVYLLSVTGFFLFLTVQSMEKRRWSE